MFPHTASIVALVLATSTAIAQLSSPDSKPRITDRSHLMHAIEVSEAELKQSETAHLSAQQLAMIYCNLGERYRDAGWFPKSEDAMLHAISLLRKGSPTLLADEISNLATLHIEMNEPRQAEKDVLEGLSVREAIGDPVGVALSHGDLAAIYVKQRQFRKAMDSATQAIEVLDNNPKAKTADRITARQTLAFAFMGMHRLNDALPLLEDSVRLAAAASGPDSLLLGQADYLLGEAYWQAGKLDLAAELMERGITAMRPYVGWGHPVYLQVVERYAQLLRKRGEPEAAASAEREVRQATQVVDIRSIAARPK